MYCPNPHSELYKELMIINKNDKDLVYYAYHEIEKLQEMGLISNKRYKMPDGTMRYTINKTINEKSLAESYRGGSGFTIDLAKKQKLDNYIKQFNISFLNTQISKSGKAIFVNITPVKNHVIEDIRSEDERKLEEGYKQNKKEGNWDVNSEGDIVHPDDMYQEDNKVNYDFKVVKIINDNIKKILNWFNDKSINKELFWNKIQQLGIPKEQLELLKNSEGNTISQKLVSFLANYSYTIEINTAKDFSHEKSYGEFIIENNQWYNRKEHRLATKEEVKEIEDELIQYGRNKYNTQHYSNLTAPGGINYIEEEIAIPAITPSIKGHAQFSTDNGIGWFRSDDRRLNRNEEQLEGYEIGTPSTIVHNEGELTKTRRILEVQSDLFQKGREKESLTKILKSSEIPVNKFIYGDKFSDFKTTFIKKEDGKWYDAENSKYPLTEQVVVDGYNSYASETGSNKIPQNQFLQLLNKDNNWVTFFVKSIIQDSAKKGYEKVLFPKGDTASKIEGHSTLEDFKKQKENRIKELEKTQLKYFGEQLTSDYEPTGNITNWYSTEQEAEEAAKKEYENYQIGQTDGFDNSKEINQLKQELERVEREGFAALRPIYKFYEETVSNILKKNYKDNIKEITDEYGNKWYQLDIIDKHKENILFQNNNTSKQFNIQLNSKIKNFLSKIGVNTVNVEQILDKNGNPISAIAVAKMLNKIIQVVENKADITTLPEETAHFFVELLKDNQLLNKMLKDIVNYPEYKEVRDSEFYQKQYKGDETLIRKEAVGKLIGRIIAKQETSEQATSWWGRVWNKIKSIFNGKSSLFEEIASDIRKGDISKLDSSKSISGSFYQDEQSKKYGDYEVISGMPFQESTLEKMKSGEQRITIKPRNHVSGNYKLENGAEFNIINLGKKSIADFKNPDWVKKNFKGDDYTESEEKFKHINQWFDGKNEMYVYQITKIDNKIKNEYVKENPNLEQTEESLNKPKEKQKYLGKFELIYQRRISRLTKELNEKGISQARHDKIKAEIDYTLKQLESFNTDQSEDKLESSGEFGEHLLNLAKEKLNNILESKQEPTMDMINYFNEIIDTYTEHDILASKALSLKRQVSKLADKALNEKLQSETGHSLAEAEKQNQDIPFMRKWTGSLLDLDNIYANTIGRIIRSSQTKIERLSKALQSEINGKLKALESTSERKASEIYKECIHVSKDGKTTLLPNPAGLSKEAEEFYWFYRQKMRELIKIMPTLTYRNSEGVLQVFNLTEFFIPNVPKDITLKDKLKESKNPLRVTGVIKTRKLGNSVRDEDDKADIIPLEYILSLDESAKTDDLGYALFKFATSVYNQHEMSSILPTLRTIQRKIYDTNYIQKSNPKNTKSGKDSGIYKIVDGFIDAQVKGKYKKEQGMYSYNQYEKDGDVFEDYVDIRGTIDNMLRWNSLKRIGLSIPGAIANVEFGQLSNLIEAIGGEHYNRKQLRQAKKIFISQNFNKDSILNSELLSKYNILQELNDYELAESVKFGSRKRISKEKLMEIMYAPQKWGEKYIQSSSLLAMMLHDGYIDSNGELTTKWTNSTEKQKEDFILKVTGVNNKLHGRYSPKEAAIAQQDVFYRAISQFRKFIPAAYEARFDKKHFDSRLGHEIEGRYLTFGREVLGKIFTGEGWNNLFLPLISAQKALAKDNLTENEIANIRKTAFESLIVIGCVILGMIGGGSSDEDKKRRKSAWYKSLMLSLNRVSGDVAFFYSPDQLNNLAKNAVPMTQLTGDIIKLGKYTMSQFGDAPEFKGGNAKGQNKLVKGLLNITPGSNIIQDATKVLNDNPLDEIK